MTLKDRLMADLREAMKSRDVSRRSAIRLALAAIKRAEIDRSGSLEDADIGRCKFHTIEAPGSIGHRCVYYTRCRSTIHQILSSIPPDLDSCSNELSTCGISKVGTSDGPEHRIG